MSKKKNQLLPMKATHLSILFNRLHTNIKTIVENNGSKSKGKYETKKHRHFSLAKTSMYNTWTHLLDTNQTLVSTINVLDSLTKLI